MKSSKVDHVTSDEQLVRLSIFEGRIPMDDAGESLLQLARAEAARNWALYVAARDELARIRAKAH